MSRATSVVAYQYRADQYTPAGVIEAGMREERLAALRAAYAEWDPSPLRGA